VVAGTEGRSGVDGFDVVVERIVSSAGQVMLIGGLDTGKTTLGRALARAALDAGRTVAYLDADVGQKSVGPPTTVTLRLLGTREDLELERMARHDAMAFVGATSPQGQLLPLVVGSALMLARARST